MYSNFVLMSSSVTNLRYAFTQSDNVGQIVVILLSLISIVTWTIMIEKGMALYRAKSLSEAFIDNFRDRTNLYSLYEHIKEEESPVAETYEYGLTELVNMYKISNDKINLLARNPEQYEKQLSVGELEAVRSSLERGVSDQILKLENGMSFLATAVSVSPFFGLFGTVWGVMMAFCGIAMVGKADISALAPGVSGALLTTVVGLLVAIPSLIGYNILTATIRKIIVYMDNFVEEFMSELKIKQM